MGHAPENTMASFEKALGLGADIIELDVHLSRDGHLIVIHDPMVERTTDGMGYVQGLTLEELKALDAGRHFRPAFAGERIPTLDEVLEWAKGKMAVAIEVKNGPVYYSGIEEKVVEVLDQHGMTDSALVISFDHICAKKIKEIQPKLVTGVLYACRPVSAVGMARQADASMLLPHWSYVVPQLIEEAHSAGLIVGPWVVDDPALMKWLIDIGVDAIGTNYPDQLRAVLETSKV